MTTNINEGNKLIAEFVGFEFDEHGFITNNPLRIHLNVDHDLRFHTSFDWIMPVVEWIAKEHSMFRLNIGNVASYCYFDENDDVTKRSSNESTILCVWYSVVQFIKWYNSVKTQLEDVG